MNLSAKIEAILFWKNEPVSEKRLCDILKLSSEEFSAGILELKNSLAGRGIVLLVKDKEYSLGTAPELSRIIEDLQKEELNKDLSRAALETLSVILYRDGASRSEIDFIRGVNSSFILRALSVRGLVEKTTDPKDQRRFVYKPTTELISFMGVKSVAELPEYENIKKAIENTAENLETESKKEE